MKYDFDKIIERRGTGAIKTDVLKERYGRDDLTALWVAAATVKKFWKRSAVKGCTMASTGMKRLLRQRLRGCSRLPISAHCMAIFMM